MTASRSWAAGFAGYGQRPADGSHGGVAADVLAGLDGQLARDLGDRSAGVNARSHLHE
jgi:hypothetical protein